MTFRTAKNSALGVPLIGTSYSATDHANFGLAVGARCRGSDDAGLGDGEFIWLPASVAVAKDDLVTYKTSTAVTALLATTAIKGRPLAKAMVAHAIGEYGWFQLSGAAILNAAAGSGADVAIYASATPGSVTTTQANGVAIGNAVAESALNTPAAGKIYAQLNYPFVQTQVV